MNAKIPMPVVIGVAIFALGLAVFFGMRMIQASEGGVPVELAEMQAEAERKRSPGYGKEENPGAAAPATVPTEPSIPVQPGFSPGRMPEDR